MNTADEFPYLNPKGRGMNDKMFSQYPDDKRCTNKIEFWNEDGTCTVIRCQRMKDHIREFPGYCGVFFQDDESVARLEWHPKDKD